MAIALIKFDTSDGDLSEIEFLSSFILGSESFFIVSNENEYFGYSERLSLKVVYDFMDFGSWVKRGMHIFALIPHTHLKAEHFFWITQHF